MNKDIDLKRRTKKYALSVIALYAGLNRAVVAQVIGRQFLRSGTSVGANYAEASRSRSDAEFMAKLGDCIKELEETIYWLELLVESNTTGVEAVAPVLKETREITAIFTAISKKVRLRTTLAAKRPRSII